MKTYLYRFGMICAVISTIACSAPADREAITETTERSEFRGPIKLNATSQERFPGNGMAPATPAAAPSAKGPYHFDTPQGWQQIASTQFRDPNFKIGPGGKIECYVSTLSGDGGGVLSNVNRWYAQLGMPAITQDEADALVQVQVMGHPARVVNITGTFTGMNDTADAPAEAYRLIGAIIEAPDQLITVKMTGPEAQVLPELGNFALFIDSLHSSEGHDHGEPEEHVHVEGDGHDHPAAPPLEGGAKMPADHPPIGDTQKQMPADHPPVGAAPSEAPAKSMTSGGGYAWTVPEGWAESPSSSSMRLITLAMNVEGEKPGECYVVILPGSAGGRLDNYNRWLAQISNPPIDQAAMEQLPTITMFDQEVPVISCEGAYAGMSNTAVPGYMLLGASVEHNGKSLFIKLIGPKAVVTANQKQFEAFCTSLKEQP